MKPLRIARILCAVALASTAQGAPDGARDFDFQNGEWLVHHKRPLPNSTQWVEFDGKVRAQSILGGAGSLEEQFIPIPGGTYYAIAVRAYDAKSREWLIRWLDGRYPGGPLDPGAKGRFENGIGNFYADYEQDGKPMRGRLKWFDITARSASFEQAATADGGKTWSANWIMTFERLPPSEHFPAAAPLVHDFDFLHGEWDVSHRYLVVKDGKAEWRETTGTANTRPTLGGSGNVEDHAIERPGGQYLGFAVRSYDAKNKQWSIWWIDGRDPHGPIDPPARGGFNDGVGTFFWDLTVDGKPTRGRLTWSRTATASPKWEQAYSYDVGKTWQTNWVMEFRRRAGPAPAS